MAFLAEGKEGIGAVRAVAADHIVVYVENGGEFKVARSAVRRVHDDKVILDPGQARQGAAHRARPLPRPRRPQAVG